MTADDRLELVQRCTDYIRVHGQTVRGREGYRRCEVESLVIESVRPMADMNDIFLPKSTKEKTKGTLTLSWNGHRIFTVPHRDNIRPSVLTDVYAWVESSQPLAARALETLRRQMVLEDLADL